MPLIVSTPSSSELSLLLQRKSDLEVSSSCRSSRWRTSEVRATRKTGQMTSAQAEGNPPSPRSGPLKKEMIQALNCIQNVVPELLKKPTKQVQSTLGFETLDKAAALGLETANPLTAPCQYINSNLGFRNLKFDFYVVK